MRIRLRTVGRPDPLLREVARRYLERLRPFLPVTWEEIPESRLPPRERPKDEGARLFADLTGTTVLLDEAGREWSSTELAAMLSRWLSGHGELVFLVGGPFGVDEAARARADHVWSLSRLTFPHDLVPVLVLEQLYRAETIRRGLPYHHGRAVGARSPREEGDR